MQSVTAVWFNCFVVSSHFGMDFIVLGWKSNCLNKYVSIQFSHEIRNHEKNSKTEMLICNIFRANLIIF